MAKGLAISAGLIFGIICSLLMIVGGYIYIPLPMPYLPTLIDRVLFALRWQTLPLTALLAVVVRQACEQVVSGRRTVVSSSANPTGEQVLLSCVSQLTFATYVEEAALKFIPLTAALFAVGSLLLWNSQNASAFRRSFGLTMVLFCPCLATLYGTFSVVWRGAGLRLGRPPIY